MNRIEELRKARNLSGPQLGALMGTSRQTVYKLQSGKMKYAGWIDRLTGALNCTADDLRVDGVPLTPDVEPVAAQVTGYAGLKRRGISFYRVVSDVLNEAGIVKGGTVAVDQSTNQISEINPGDAIVIRVPKMSILLLRQFIPPFLLTTNQIGPYNTTLKLNDLSIAPELVGVVLPNGGPVGGVGS